LALQAQKASINALYRQTPRPSAEIKRSQSRFRAEFASKRAAFLATRDLAFTEELRHAPRNFWRRLNYKTRPPGPPGPATIAHFRQLLDIPVPPVTADVTQLLKPNPRQSAVGTSVGLLVGGQRTVPDALAAAFTEAEVKVALGLLANNKAPDPRGLKAEHLKGGAEVLIPHLTVILNRFYTEGFPPAQAIAHLIPIHKKGDPRDPANYRGISIITIVAKLYATLLNYRLSTALETAGCRSRWQAGFRPRHSTTDHIYTLLDLTTRAQRRGSAPIHVCFVDFSKAFDSVPRELLWRRLELLHVPAKTITAIRSYYDHVDVRVEMIAGLSDAFPSTLGVKQGCPLSPTLFGIFIDAYSDLLDRDPNRPPDGPWKARLRLLLYADDLVLVGYHARDLQQQLRTLETFCQGVGMAVNPDKTQIVQFRHAPDPVPTVFYYAGRPLQQVDHYRYLGFDLHATKSPAKHGIPDRLAAARRAIFALEANCRALAIRNIETRLRLFESLVQPVALFACEAWLPFMSSDWLKSDLEQLQRDFLLRLGKHRRCTLQTALLWEYGRLPLQRVAISRALAYHNRLCDGKVCAPYQFQRVRDPVRGDAQGPPALLRTKLQEWLTVVHVLLDLGNSPRLFVRHQLKPIDLPKYLAAYDERYKAILIRDLDPAHPTSRHRATYGAWRGEFGYARFADAHDRPPRTPAARFHLHRFRLLNVDLPIEKGAWAGLPRDARVCPHCAANPVAPRPPPVGDAQHVVLSCPALTHLRAAYSALDFSSFDKLFSTPALFGAFLARALPTYAKPPVPPP